jgi:hypothetical protein
VTQPSLFVFAATEALIDWMSHLNFRRAQRSPFKIKNVDSQVASDAADLDEANPAPIVQTFKTAKYFVTGNSVSRIGHHIGAA